MAFRLQHWRQITDQYLGVKMRNVLKTPLTLTLILFSYCAFAKSDWLCTEESSQRDGDLIKACGIGESKLEGEARSKALESAKQEFQKICEMSDNCKGRGSSVDPGRTTCDKTATGYKCFRMLSITVTQTRQVAPLGQDSPANILPEAPPEPGTMVMAPAPDGESNSVHPIADEMTTPTYWTAFAQKVCGLNWKKARGRSKKDCQEKWNDSFTARLHEEYPSANFADVDLKCKGRSLQCSPQKIEEWANESQQSSVAESNRLQAARDEAAEQEQKQERRAKWKRAIGAAFGAMGRAKTNGTTCVSTPNGAGGYVTRCN